MISILRYRAGIYHFSRLPTSVMSRDTRLELLTQTKDHFNHYINQADQKAAILISGHLAILGFLTNSNEMIGSNICTYLLIVFSSASILTGVITIFPRHEDGNSDTPKLGNLNWKKVAKEDSNQYIQTVLSDEIDNGLDSIAASNHALSNVLERKYYWLKVSMVGTVGTLITIISLIVGQL
ncbi:Pycsar system effector family protein [Halolamina pelagica]|nr:Pycsar system effector family protein [Halolamina pelagica]